MDDFIALSALQHYAYCPRQFALIHVEQAWAENRFTAEGQLLHQRVDSGERETRGKIRYERGVQLVSHIHGIHGKMDLLEVESSDPPSFYPVEYKRGKPKVQSWDRVQLCAQALCLEEMRQLQIQEGAIWYWEVRKRERVIIDMDLRNETIEIIANARKTLLAGKTPPPIADKKRCRACSLIELCKPETFRKDRTGKYLESMDE